MLTVVAFGLAWWLGLYLIARDPRKATLQRAGLGLLVYGLALAADQPFLDERVHTVLLCLPAVLWTGVLVSLLPDPAETERQWLRIVAPASLVVAAASVFFAPLAGLVVVPLFWALALLLRRRARLGTGLGVLVAALLLFGLGSGLVLLGFLDDLPGTLLLAGIGLDLLLLGGCVAMLDAFDEGEAIRRDMVWSLVIAGGVAILFGSQVALAALLVDRSLDLLLYGVVAAAITVQVLARPINALADRFAFRDAPDLRQERTALREVAAALPRRAPAPLFGVDDDEFARLTRRALSHYADLGKLASSPLAALPVITDRLAERGIPDAPLARATELKSVLLATITRLKPADGDSGTSDEWRHYNALYFYYVAGVRPYSVRTKVTELDPSARRALAWFVDQVPERTLHNWQAAAAKIVAAELRAPVAPS
ncbi:MAG: hypothetical protein WBA97_00520 [Actinophytocola sp.]|uniref:hypothetical protein n=1 Tax=Actinophytocola sp. TaxID=1872138 RepID=UPI003C73B58E